MGQGGGQGKGGGEGAGQIHSRKKPSRWLWYTPLGITRPTACSSPSHQAVPTLIVLFKLHFEKWICREAKLGRKGLSYEFRLGEFSGAVDVFRHWMWRLHHMHSLKLTHGTFTWANFATCKLHLDEAAKKRIHPNCVCGRGVWDNTSKLTAPSPPAVPSCLWDLSEWCPILRGSGCLPSSATFITYIRPVYFSVLS